jgi:hypothetical protein
MFREIWGFPMGACNLLQATCHSTGTKSGRGRLITEIVCGAPVQVRRVKCCAAHRVGHVGHDLLEAAYLYPEEY